MKKLKQIILIIALILIKISLFAQVTATPNASAIIISPTVISKTADMNFGNVAVSNSLDTVVLSPAGTRSAIAGITLSSTTGTPIGGFTMLTVEATINVRGYQLAGVYSSDTPFDETLNYN